MALNPKSGIDRPGDTTRYPNTPMRDLDLSADRRRVLVLHHQTSGRDIADPDLNPLYVFAHVRLHEDDLALLTG